MSLHPEVMIRIIKSTVNPEAAVDKIKSLENIQRQIIERDRQIEGIRKQAAKDIANLESIQFCNHEFLETCNDPSGGSDREKKCLVCGEYV